MLKKIALYVMMIGLMGCGFISIFVHDCIVMSDTFAPDWSVTTMNVCGYGLVALGVIGATYVCLSLIAPRRFAL